MAMYNKCSALFILLADSYSELFYDCCIRMPVTTYDLSL